MKQASKKSEPKEQEMTVVKGAKQIPLKSHPQNKEFTTSMLIGTVLSYNPKMVDPETYMNWGLTISEMVDRKDIRKKLDELGKDSKYITLTDSQAKHLADMCYIIKWNGEDDFIMEFWESLK